MRITSNSNAGLLVLVLFSLLASGIVAAADAQMTTGQRGAIASSATADQLKAAQVNDELTLPEQPIPESASSSPVRPKGERPKLGLCDGS